MKLVTDQMNFVLARGNSNLIDWLTRNFVTKTTIKVCVYGYFVNCQHKKLKEDIALGVAVKRSFPFKSLLKPLPIFRFVRFS